MQQKRRVGAGEIAVDNEEQVAADAERPQRHHRLHPEGDENQHGSGVTHDVRSAHVRSSPVVGP